MVKEHAWNNITTLQEIVYGVIIFFLEAIEMGRQLVTHTNFVFFQFLKDYFTSHCFVIIINIYDVM